MRGQAARRGARLDTTQPKKRQSRSASVVASPSGCQRGL